MKYKDGVYAWAPLEHNEVDFGAELSERMIRNDILVTGWSYNLSLC